MRNFTVKMDATHRKVIAVSPATFPDGRRASYPAAKNDRKVQPPKLEKNPRASARENCAQAFTVAAEKEMTLPIDIPHNWKEVMEQCTGRISNSSVSRMFDVSIKVVVRWRAEIPEFELMFKKQEIFPVDHSPHICHRIDDLIFCHDAQTVLTVQISPGDLVKVLQDVREYYKHLQTHNRRLASEINRTKHSAHLRNSRGLSAHASYNGVERPHAVSDPVPDT